MSAGSLAGGCLCGAVRYRAEGPVIRVNHCHCGQCRRVSGAIAATWAAVPVAGFVIEGARPAEFRASDFATRSFCGACGSTLFWKRDGAEKIDIAVGTLDDAAAIRAGRHDHVEVRLPGFALDPQLPSFCADGTKL
ncbi:MAG: GFA family protein [Alphaproteobacteria bacterium]|nr:GFA family protein [Alphaproteobacteria bacterium]